MAVAAAVRGRPPGATRCCAAARARGRRSRREVLRPCGVDSPHRASLLLGESSVSRRRVRGIHRGGEQAERWVGRPQIGPLWGPLRIDLVAIITIGRRFLDHPCFRRETNDAMMSGTLAGTGSFRCLECAYVVTLAAEDRLPNVPVAVASSSLAHRSSAIRASRAPDAGRRVGGVEAPG